MNKHELESYARIEVYLAAGTDVVILVDPLARTMDAYDRPR